MTAVLGLDAGVIESTLKGIDGIVSIANYNCPGQIVITGETKAVEMAATALQEAGAKRCIPLKVSGPFHSALLTDAGKKLGEALSKVETHKPRIPYVCNVEADYVTFIEIGPGKTLTGFMRKINKDVKVMNVDKLADMEKVLEELGC